MMMTADYSRGWTGDQYPNAFRTHPAAMTSNMTPQPHKPLRHGIDAILHKAPSSSHWSTHNTHTKPTLPHIETLRRSAMSGVSVSLFNPGCEVQTPNCVVPCEDGEDSRGAHSSQSSSDSGEEQEDVVVVDDTESVSMEADSTEEHSQDPDSNKSQQTSHTSERHVHNVALSRGDLTHHPNLSPQSRNPTTRCSAFRGNVNLGTDIIPGSTEKVKSAFRPIVRPWLLENERRPCSDSVMSKATVCRDPFRVVGPMTAKGTQSSLRSLDAISMLRKQSSAFRVACTNNRPLVHKNNVMMTMASPAIDNGQPLPSSLTSWFSWLRSGGLHFGTQPPSQQFPPGAPPPCRGVMPPSGATVPAPPQAPRYNCEACGKSYSTFGGLSKHKQFHCTAQIKKDFRCKFCDKSYSSLGALKMHIRTHTLPCKCSVCGKAFSRPWLLQGHLRTHTGEKPFSCPHCARAFADRSNLRAHLQTHSDVKKYSCRHCSKTFSRMSLLVKHRESSCLGLHS